MVKISPLLSRKILGAALIISTIATGCGSREEEAAAPPALPVKTQTIETATIQDSSEFVGTLEAQERVQLASRVDGRIIRITAQEGEQVNRGEQLVELQLIREQEEVNAAVSNVNVQKATLNNSQAELEAARAEAASAASEVETQRANLANAEAELEDTKAELELAQVNLKRAEVLVEEGAQARQSLDDRTRDIRTATAQQEAAIASRNAAKGSLEASIRNLKAAEARIKAAEANVDQQNAALSQAQAQVGVASQNLEYNRITAPINGTVGDIVPKVGDYITAGQQITSITQNQTLDLYINVPVERSAELKTGLPVEIVSQGEEGVSGRISFVSPTVNQNNQAIQAKATFNNDGSLRDEQFVRVRVIWEEKPGVLIPTEAVSKIGGENFVFVAQEQENSPQSSGNTEGAKEVQQQQNSESSEEPTLVARQKSVVLGSIQGQNYQVVSGIKAGEKIVTSGILNLSDGTAITEESITSEKNSEL